MYQFKRIPFGLKNAVPCFQRVINDIITAHGCKGTFAYLDDITVCGRTKEEHDANLKVFLNAAKECNPPLNEGKNQPVERLSLDFKGPLPSLTKNHYTLTVVDEYSRFPFAFPCRSTDAETVISCLNQLFTLLGMPAYVHSDRGPAFVSHDLISYLHQRGIGCSNTSIYNPRGNGQCERYNGIIWSSVKLAVKSRKLHISQWELVLPDVLHSIRSLLCTTTNETPHERLFKHKRRSSFGVSVPTWLSSPGRVYLRRHANPSKYDPVVEEVDLVHATPSYARVRFPTGRETTVFA